MRLVPILGRQAAAAACLLLLSLSGCAHRGSGAAAPAPAVADGATPAPLVLHQLDSNLPRSGQWRNGFDLADVDGDGHLDLVLPPARKGARVPMVLLGDGTGRFSRWSEARFPARDYDYGAAVAADLDGDGRPDVALAVHLSGLVALRQEVGGVFADISTGLPWGRPGSGFSSRTLAAADWDGDGRDDLVSFGEGPSRFGLAGGGPLGLAVFLNRGDHWQRLAPAGADPSFGDSLAVADVDGDGRPDAVTSSGGASGRALVHLGTGTGWRDVEVGGLPPRALVGAVAAADIDGDGRAEVLLTTLEPADARWSWRVLLLRWDGGGLAQREVLRGEGRNLVRAAALADLDGEGRSEAVLLQDDGGLRVIPLGRPEGAVLVHAPSWRDGCSGYGLRVGDLTGDGRPEIVASFAGESSGFPGEPQCTSGGGIQAWSVARGR